MEKPTIIVVKNTTTRVFQKHLQKGRPKHRKVVQYIKYYAVMKKSGRTQKMKLTDMHMW